MPVPQYGASDRATLRMAAKLRHREAMKKWRDGGRKGPEPKMEEIAAPTNPRYSDHIVFGRKSEE